MDCRGPSAKIPRFRTSWWRGVLKPKLQSESEYAADDVMVCRKDDTVRDEESTTVWYSIGATQRRVKVDTRVRERAVSVEEDAANSRISLMISGGTQGKTSQGSRCVVSSS